MVCNYFWCRLRSKYVVRNERHPYKLQNKTAQQSVVHAWFWRSGTSVTTSLLKQLHIFVVLYIRQFHLCYYLSVALLGCYTALCQQTGIYVTALGLIMLLSSSDLCQLVHSGAPAVFLTGHCCKQAEPYPIRALLHEARFKSLSVCLDTSTCMYMYVSLCTFFLFLMCI